MIYEKNSTIGRSSRSRMFFKIGVLKNLAIFTVKHLCWGFFLITACNFAEKEIPKQVCSCEFCEIFRNIFFNRTLLLAVSEQCCKLTLYSAWFIRTTPQQGPIEMVPIDNTGKWSKDFEVYFSNTVRTTFTALFLD